QPGGDTRLEKLAVPLAVRSTGQGSGVRAADYVADIDLDDLKSLPITARRECTAALAVDTLRIGVPVSCPHAFDQSDRDAVAFDRERMVRVGAVNIIDKLQKGRGVFGPARRRRKDVQHHSAHRFPHGLYP